MKIAFYAPLKSPNHPVPSGDRLMARQLMLALEMAGHEVTLASELRARMSDANDQGQAQRVSREAEAEVARLTSHWRAEGSPDIWFAYHPYYKSPDLIGPQLCSRFGLPYVTAESSYSARRSVGIWASNQSRVLDGLGRAVVNVCLTRRDREGIHFALPGARTALLPPFVDVRPFQIARSERPAGEVVRLITVAMMRDGEKLRSYRMLAAALHGLPDALRWTLDVVGAGPAEQTVRELFADFGDRIIWRGQLSRDEVALALAASDVFVWPGFGEAYGLSYLEAQASGLPVVAQDTAGIPEVVATGQTGILTELDDTEAFAGAIASLIREEGLRRGYGAAARRHVTEHHSLSLASERLDHILATSLSERRDAV